VPELPTGLDCPTLVGFPLKRAFRAIALGTALCASFLPVPLQGKDAGELQARHAALREQLANNPFGRPLHVESREASGKHSGEVYATIDKPYDSVGSALKEAERWCDILILPANVKRCEAPDGDALALHVVRTPRDPLERAYRVDFKFDAAAGRDYLRAALSAAQGPFGTTDYRITLEAAPIDAQRTFIHMSYSYGLGFAARLAMNAYLATSGRDKVGFSVVDRRAGGAPVYVDGPRGAIERNAMRYFLAVEAYLDALGVAPKERLEKSLRDWYAGIERYPRQLKEELRRDEYLELKRAQLSRP
jgi:hypothetical protein